MNKLCSVWCYWYWCHLSPLVAIGISAIGRLVMCSVWCCWSWSRLIYLYIMPSLTGESGTGRRSLIASCTTLEVRSLVCSKQSGNGTQMLSRSSSKHGAQQVLTFKRSTLVAVPKRSTAFPTLPIESWGKVGLHVLPRGCRCVPTALILSKHASQNIDY